MNYYNPYYYPYSYFSYQQPKNIFERLFHHHFDFHTIMNNTSKTLNVINQAIPLIKQAKPIFHNAKAMFQIVNEFKRSEEGEEEKPIKKENHPTTNGPIFFL